MVLVADFGHEGRPQGADPFDVRDEIDWIDSIVKTKPPESTPPRLEELFAFLNEWTISEKDRSRLSATQTWSSQEGRWVHALKLAVPPGSENIKQKAPMLLGKPGVHFEHYIEYTEANLPDFDKLTPKTTGTHPTISLEIPDLPLDRVALRFKTTLVVPRDGFYSFFLKSDDGSKMYINGKEVLNNDGLHPVIEKVTRVALRKGGVPIQVEYFNGAGVRHLSLEWKGPGFPRQIIKPESFDLAKIDASSGPEVEYVALEPITLNRTVKITSANEWLSLRAGRDENGIGDYVFEVRVNGKTIPEMAQKEVHTRYLQPMQLAGGIWHLGDHAGRTINLQVAIKPLGYHGQQVPALHFQQLQSGPESPERKDRFIAKDLLGDWRLEGSLSTINKSYHNGLLSGGDGALRLAPDGTVAMWLRLPSGERKAGAGYVVRLDNAMVFDYVNADWVTDSVQPSSDRKSLIVQEQEAESSWNLIFTRNELSSFAEYAGQWKLQAEVSKVDNTVHSGMFAGGSGSLSIGRDGGVRIQLQYPPNAQGQVQNGGSIGQLVRKEGDVIIKYEDETWNDDRVEWSDDRKSLTVRELKNAEGWTLVFVKR